MLKKQPTIYFHRPKLYPKQFKAFYNDARYSIVESSTKSGKTIGCIAWLLEQAYFHSPLSVKQGVYWWVAPVYAQAKIAFNRMRRAIPTSEYDANESELKLTLKHNNAAIFFKSGEKPDTLYGEDVHATVIDEASRVKEEAWLAVRSTLTHTRGKARIIGNVRGRNNWAYKLGQRAKAGEQDMEYHCITAQDAVEAGVIEAKELEDAARAFKGREAFFRELYFCEPAEDGGNPFGLSAIADCLRPMGVGEPVAIGIDLARAVDWTVVIGLNASGHVCLFERFQKPWTETVEAVVKIVNNRRALVDSTGVGDSVIDQLQRRSANFEGFKFSSTSKQQIMEGLAMAISSQKIGFPDGVIKDELDCFEYEYHSNGVRYSAPSGLHDDCVCALALAVQQMHSRIKVGRLTNDYLFSTSAPLAQY